MCVQTSKPNNEPSTTKPRNNNRMNARSKRRERRALLRKNKALPDELTANTTHATPVTSTAMTVVSTTSSSDDTQSTASCSVTTCESPLQLSQDEEIFIGTATTSTPSKQKKSGKSNSQKQKKNNKTKNAKKSKKSKKNNKPIVVEVEELSEQEKSMYVGLDCEMVIIEDQTSTVARVSIVNWYGEAIYNKFIKVDQPVTDYLTFVSGVRKEDIESDEAISFEECRQQVLDIIYGKVVVGHALKNDFLALDITHPWHLIRDTARYEPFMVESKTNPDILLPRKLKVLAKNKLGMIIQEDGQEHCSIEDATAAMDLYKKARRKWEIAVEWKVQKTNSLTGMTTQQSHF